ncbi:MAG: hypothetical protein Aurels2KO_57100 [Aureliella sp.]
MDVEFSTFVQAKTESKGPADFFHCIELLPEFSSSSSIELQIVHKQLVGNTPLWTWVTLKPHSITLVPLPQSDRYRREGDTEQQRTQGIPL